MDTVTYSSPAKISDIQPCLDALRGVSRLDENQAKTLAYYCAMTFSDEPKLRPIINITGESGTGKCAIMKQILPWCYEAVWIVARNMTTAVLRDKMADTHTVFVEEADKVVDLKQAENWYQYRYDDSGKAVPYNRTAINKWDKPVFRFETHNHFGYTILHTQNPFISPEMDRRTLRLTVYKDPSRIYRITPNVSESLKLAAAGLGVDWNKSLDWARSGSAWDVWLPLMRVADYLEDQPFIDYAKEQIALKSEEDKDTQMYEPKGIVLSELVPLYQESLSVGLSTLIPVTEIRAELKKRDSLLTERQITQITRELGFTVVKPKNKAHIKVTSLQQLREICEKTGVPEILAS